MHWFKKKIIAVFQKVHLLTAHLRYSKLHINIVLAEGLYAYKLCFSGSQNRPWTSESKIFKKLL